MENVFSNLPPESIPLSDSSEKMPDFNNIFQESVSKMMGVTDDLHQMVDYMRDLRNMKTWEMYIQLAFLTIIGILIFFILKYQNGNQKQKRRRRSNRDKYRFNDIRSEHSTIGNRYMNENSDAFMSKVPAISIDGNSDAPSDGSFDDVLMCGDCRFQPNDINEFADHKSRKCSNIAKPPSEPESIQCCENTFKSSWKLLQHLTDKHNLNLYRDASTTNNIQERRGPQTPSSLQSESENNHPTTLIMNDDHTFIPSCVSREMLCNENSSILCDSTDAHEMSKDYCNGEIVDEEKQTCTYDK